MTTVKNKYIKTLELILTELPYICYSEHRFHDKRRFRLDYYIPIENESFIKGLGIEYNGINYRNSNFSRHTNTTGYINDCDKTNLALLSGIPILQLTFKQLESPDKVKYMIINIVENIKRGKDDNIKSD
jgi:hypothetical protein